MFEDRSIPVMAYNLYNILAEKIETILSRNVTNSRGRDFYDVYMLLTINRDGISRDDLMHAINVKAKERNSTHNVIDYKKHLDDITKSPEIDKIWTGYMKNYPYAEGITMPDITATISSVFDA